MPTLTLPADASLQETAVTRGRVTHFRFDISEPKRTAAAFSYGRRLFEMCRDGFGPEADDITRTGTGAITLKNRSTQQVAESGDPDHTAITKDFWDFPDNSATGGAWVEEVPTYRAPSDLPGVDASGWGGGLTSQGGSRMEKRSGGAGYPLNNAADAAAFPGPVVPTPVPMDRWGSAPRQGQYPANSGFLLTAHNFGYGGSGPTRMWEFYFGGQLFRDGGGELCLTVTGDGVAFLFVTMPVFAAGSGSTVLQWVPWDSWRIADTEQLHGQPHQIRIHPYLSLDTPHIDFHSGPTDQAPPAGAHGGLNAVSSLPRTKTFSLIELERIAAMAVVDATVLTRVRADIRELKAIAPGMIRLGARSDQMPGFQVHQASYPASAAGDDQPFVIEDLVLSGDVATLTWEAASYAANGPSVICSLYDASTRTPLSVVGTNPPNSVTYNLTPGQQHYYVHFDLVSSLDHLQPPVLSGWMVRREGRITTWAPGEWGPVKPGSFVTALSLQGAENDPQASTGTMTIEDIAYNLPRLNHRGRIPVLIETEYDAAHPTKRVGLFRGYALRNDAVRQSFNLPPGDNFPSRDWRSYTCSLVSIFDRLQKAKVGRRFPWPVDELAPSLPGGAGQPLWKVTDVVRLLLAWAGFTPDYIDVPDSGLRFFPYGDKDKDLQLIQPETPIGKLVFDLITRYLGWYLVYDCNAGSTGLGMWRVRKPPLPDGSGNYAARWNFTTQNPTPSVGIAMVTQEKAFAPGTTWIQAESLRTYVVPPEFNLLWVTGSGQLTQDKDARYNLNGFWVNPLSYQFPGGPAPDPDSPDYLGELVSAWVPDPSIGQVVGSNPRLAIDWMTRRLAALAGHGMKFVSFDAPLVFITDTADVITIDTGSTHRGPFTTAPAYRTLSDSTIQPRPLYFGDPVTITDHDSTVSQWIVRSVSPGWDCDRIQMAHYELQSIPPRYEPSAILGSL